MTINPVDMQVLLPQTGQVNRLQRGLQFQQQTEQQIVGQGVNLEMKNKENTVVQTAESMPKKTQDQEHGKKRQSGKDKTGSERTGNKSSDTKSSDDKTERLPVAGSNKGTLLDIRI